MHTDSHLQSLVNAGMTPADAATSLKIIDLRYPGTSLDEHLERVAWATADATAEDRLRILQAQFGSDAMRAAHVLLSEASA